MDYHLTCYFRKRSWAQKVGMYRILYLVKKVTIATKNISLKFYYVTCKDDIETIIHNKKKSEIEVNKILTDENSIRKNIIHIFKTGI